MAGPLARLARGHAIRLADNPSSPQVSCPCIAQASNFMLFERLRRDSALFATMMHAMTNALLRRVIAPIGVLAVLLSALAAPSSAQAASDTTGPTLTVDVVSSYAVGQETGDSPFFEPWGDFFPDPATSRNYKWTATDASGICRYTVDEEYSVDGWNEGGGEINVTITHSTSGQYTFTVDRYTTPTTSAGSGSTPTTAPATYQRPAPRRLGRHRARLRAHHPERLGPQLMHLRDRGLHDADLDQERVAEHRGERARHQHARRPGHGQGPGPRQGCDLLRRPYVTTVDTYASINTNRIVMWDKGLLRTGDHTIKVVNLATSGRPRIDIDAYIH